jgi:hypothetical protein
MDEHQQERDKAQAVQFGVIETLSVFGLHWDIHANHTILQNISKTAVRRPAVRNKPSGRCVHHAENNQYGG